MLFSSGHMLRLAFAVLFVKYTFNKFLLALNMETGQNYMWLYETDRRIVDTLLEPFTPFTTVGEKEGADVLEKINDYLFKLTDLYHLYRHSEDSVKKQAIDISRNLSRHNGPMFVQQPYNENELRSKYYWNDTEIFYLNKMFEATRMVWKKIKIEFMGATGKLDLNKI